MAIGCLSRDQTRFAGAALVAALFLSGWIGCTHLPPRESLSHPGQILYLGYANPRVRCYRCHAVDGKGHWYSGPSLRGLKENDRGRILQKIQKGAGSMPAYSDILSPQEIEQLTGWLLGLGS